MDNETEDTDENYTEDTDENYTESLISGMRMNLGVN